MPIQVKCSKCNKLLNIRDEFAGRLGKCPFCKNVMRIPPKPGARPAAAAPAAPSGPAAPRPAAPVTARPTAAAPRPAAPPPDQIVLPPDPSEMAQTVILYEGGTPQPAAAPPPPPSAFAPPPGGYAVPQPAQPVPAMVAQPPLSKRMKKKGPPVILVIPVLLAFAVIGLVGISTLMTGSPNPMTLFNPPSPAPAQKPAAGAAAQPAAAQPQTGAPATPAAAPEAAPALPAAPPVPGTETGQQAAAAPSAPAVPSVPAPAPAPEPAPTAAPPSAPAAQPQPAPGLPGVPAVPGLPAVPSVPTVPGTPATTPGAAPSAAPQPVPTIPGLPAAPAAVPTVPTLPAIPGAPPAAAPSTAPVFPSAGPAPTAAPTPAAGKLKVTVISAEKSERLFVERKPVHPEGGRIFLLVTLELVASEFQQMQFGAETKKAAIVDLASLQVTDGKASYGVYGDGKDADSVTLGVKKFMYIFDSEPKIQWCYVFVIPPDATGLKIQSSQFEALALTVK